VDFADAALIFEHLVIEAEDTRTDYGESRIRALGYVDNDYYVVVYTWPGDNRLIISAWKVGEEWKKKIYGATLSLNSGPCMIVVKL
jgi:uncharacterized DUF497 family protein